MKEFLKSIIKRSPIPLSKNHAYDLQTKKIIKLFINKKSNCLDIGCHKGEILDLMLNNPSYSGLIKRKYDKKNEEDTQIQVKTELLDNVIPADMKVNLIKIDVEGGELLVLEGAKMVISRSKPLVIFEHGLGASEFYNSTPEKIFAYFNKVSMQIATLADFLKKRKGFSLEEFKQQYHNKLNYYFIAFNPESSNK